MGDVFLLAQVILACFFQCYQFTDLSWIAPVTEMESSHHHFVSLSTWHVAVVVGACNDGSRILSLIYILGVDLEPLFMGFCNCTRLSTSHT